MTDPTTDDPDPVDRARGIDPASAGECNYWPAWSEVAPDELAGLRIYEKE